MPVSAVLALDDLQGSVEYLGAAAITPPYYLFAQCYRGQFPADVELDVNGTEVSPGVRRMLAMVGAAAPFDHGRQQMEVLAGLKVTAKAVERTAGAKLLNDIGLAAAGLPKLR